MATPAPTASPEFGSLPLHDALLNSLELKWKEKLCRLHVQAFVEQNKPARAHVLEFRGVTEVSAPHNNPWGPSESINTAIYEAGRFKIEMQSGDVIEVSANEFAFVAI